MLGKRGPERRIFARDATLAIGVFAALGASSRARNLIPRYFPRAPSHETESPMHKTSYPAAAA
jgi:hypothetical protein